jgi:hypothetical protein
MILIPFRLAQGVSMSSFPDEPKDAQMSFENNLQFNPRFRSFLCDCSEHTLRSNSARTRLTSRAFLLT